MCLRARVDLGGRRIIKKDLDDVARADDVGLLDGRVLFQPDSNE
jgi:hypothetical protein